LPEFSVRESLRRELQKKWDHDWKLESTLVAGSGHVDLKGENENKYENCSNANRSTLVRPGLSAESPPNIAHFKHNAFEDEGVTECLRIIGGGKEHPFIIFDTRWGRMSFLICKDYIESHDGIKDLLKITRVDHLFIPIYNPGEGGTFKTYMGIESKKSLQAVYIVDGHKEKEPNTGKKPFYVQTPFLLSSTEYDELGNSSTRSDKRKAWDAKLNSQLDEIEVNGTISYKSLKLTTPMNL
jgi:hypothetical protein